LADSVVAAEGELYVQGGGWNIITVPSFPARQARIGVGIFVHVPYTATNEMHSFSINLRDQDGNALPIAAPSPGAEWSGGAEAPENTIDDSEVRNLPFRVQSTTGTMTVPGVAG
jgi:hypothetical protein